MHFFFIFFAIKPRNQYLCSQKLYVMMKITFEELEDRFLVSLEGKIDSAACSEVEKTLQPIYTGACKGKDIYFDCEKLLFLASGGLRVLLLIVKKARTDGSKIVMLKPNDYIKEVFTITGFINFFEIRE